MQSRVSSVVAACLAAFLFAAPVAAAGKVVVVPPGNRSATQPPVSTSSIARTAETDGSFEEKYEAVRRRLARDPKLIAAIKRTAGQYGIAPIHMIGAIVGEHTFNVDVMDSLQGYYVKALAYLNEDSLSFGYKKTSLAALVAMPEFAGCDASSSYALWSCREDVWNKSIRGKTVHGVAFPDARFEKAFFQPFYAGQTFGLGQISPLAALMVTDRVHAVGGLPLLDPARAPEVYQAVMDPDMSLQYMAALIAESIGIYKSVAGFDISKNPGLTASLYNLGGVPARARALRAANQGGLVYPQENYYGWFVNAKLADLEKLLGNGVPAN
jgi:hypothetical protein